MTATTDQGHLAATHAAAVRLDASLRIAMRDQADGPGAGSHGDRLRLLRDQADYWERTAQGRFRLLKRVLRRPLRPFFGPQIAYNRTVAERLGRIELTLEALRRDLDELREALPAVTPPRR